MVHSPMKATPTRRSPSTVSSMWFSQSTNPHTVVAPLVFSACSLVLLWHRQFLHCFPFVQRVQLWFLHQRHHVMAGRCYPSFSLWGKCWDYLLTLTQGQKRHPISGNIELHRRGYAASYSYDLRCAVWVSYFLCGRSLSIRHQTEAVKKQTDSFKADRALPRKHRAPIKAFQHAAISRQLDRGHLAPRASVGLCPISQQETFFHSNIVLQHRGLNRGLWRRLEHLTRQWAIQHSKAPIAVCVGPLFHKDIPIKRAHGVAIPHYFFMGLHYCGGENQSIGFMLPNRNLRDDPKLLFASMRSIADLEKEVRKITGDPRFALFRELPKSYQSETTREREVVDKSFWEICGKSR